MPDPIAGVLTVADTTLAPVSAIPIRVGRKTVNSTRDFLSTLEWIERRLGQITAARTQPRSQSQEPHLGQHIDFLA